MKTVELYLRVQMPKEYVKLSCHLLGNTMKKKPFEWDFHLHTHYNAHKNVLVGQRSVNGFV